MSNEIEPQKEVNSRVEMPVNTKIGKAERDLGLIENRVERTGDTGIDADDAIDRTVAHLVKDSLRSYESGELSIEEAGELVLIGVERIFDQKHDGDPATNGEKIAAVLAGAPTELLEGPLRELMIARGYAELAEVTSEIDRNNKSNFGLAA